jgi:hypothetical protein
MGTQAQVASLSTMMKEVSLVIISNCEDPNQHMYRIVQN